MKPTPEQIEKLANEIRQFLIDKQIWMDTTIYFNGKAYSTDDGNGRYAYNDPNNLIVIEDADPRRCLEYTGEILCMSFEGPLYECINGYSGAFGRKVVDRLMNIFEKYGCYYEQGYAWSLALYQEEK